MNYDLKIRLVKTSTPRKFIFCRISHLKIGNFWPIIGFVEFQIRTKESLTAVNKLTSKLSKKTYTRQSISTRFIKTGN